MRKCGLGRHRVPVSQMEGGLYRKTGNSSKNSSELKVFNNNRSSSYYLLNAHSLPSTKCMRLHLILIIAPRDIILVLHVKTLRFSSLDIRPSGQTEEGAESGPKLVVELIPMFFFIILSLHRDDEGVSRSLGSVCGENVLRFILHQKFPLLELSITFKNKKSLHSCFLIKSL